MATCPIVLIHKFFFSLLTKILFNILQGLCPGLTHGQKYGITYLPLVDTAPEDVSPTQKEPSQPTVVQSHSVVVVSDQGAHLIQSKPNSDHKNAQEVSPGGPESDPPKIWKGQRGIDKRFKT